MLYEVGWSFEADRLTRLIGLSGAGRSVVGHAGLAAVGSEQHAGFVDADVLLVQHGVEAPGRG